MIQTSLSAYQALLLENLLVKHGEIVTFQQVLDESKSTWSHAYTKKSINKMVASGWLIRIRRGLYFISNLSTRGYLPLNPHVVAGLLVKDSYVSFESALHAASMLDQYTNRIISVSLVQSKSTIVQNHEYVYVKTLPSLYFGFKQEQMDGRAAQIATPEKAILDILYFHKSKYGIDLVIEKLQQYKGELNPNLLVEFVSKYPPTTKKIVGFIFDLLKYDSTAIHKLDTQNRGSYRMLPSASKFNAKWRLYYDPYFEKYQQTI